MEIKILVKDKTIDLHNKIAKNKLTALPQAV